MRVFCKDCGVPNGGSVLCALGGGDLLALAFGMYSGSQV